MKRLLEATDEHTRQMQEMMEDSDLTEELRRRGAALSIWWPEDVILRSSELEKKGLIPRALNQEEAEEITGRLDDNHDAGLGINWDVISVYIQEYLQEKKEL